MQVFVFALVLAFASNALGDRLHGESFDSYVDHKHLVAEVSLDQLAKASAWQPDAENPPLSARRAIQVARKQMESLVADRAVWPLQNIQLLDMGDHIHWLYIVEFERQFPMTVAVYGDFSLRVPVLMDGVAVPLRPKEDKR